MRISRKSCTTRDWSERTAAVKRRLFVTGRGALRPTARYPGLEAFHQFPEPRFVVHWDEVVVVHKPVEVAIAEFDGTLEQAERALIILREGGTARRIVVCGAVVRSQRDRALAELARLLDTPEQQQHAGAVVVRGRVVGIHRQPPLDGRPGPFDGASHACRIADGLVFLNRER